jgi:cephalosporin hydroxylase
MIKQIINKINRFNARRELNKYAAPLEKASHGLTARQLVDLVFSDSWARFFWIKQEYSEILRLCEQLEKIKPKIVLEIGTAQGGSLFLFTKLAAPDAIIISIDLPNGEFGGGYEDYKSNFYRSFATGNQVMHLFREDSHSENTRKKVEAIIGTRKIDFVFIDGDHTYEGVKTDFLLYAPLADRNGIIGFHDIVAFAAGCEVHRFWNELKVNYQECKEFIENPKQPFCGIGLISPRDLIYHS